MIVNEEVQIMSNAFIIRENALIQLKCLNEEDSIATLQDLKYQDKLQREKESRIIQRYFSIKTDSQYQRFLTLKILEGLLLNSKKVLQEYQERYLYAEMQALKNEIDQLKRDISEVLMENKNNMSQTLTYLARFSRSRFDAGMRRFEEQLQENVLTPKGQDMRSVHQSPQFKIITKKTRTSTAAQNIRTDYQNQQFEPVDMKAKPFSQINNISIFTYYQRMFRMHNGAPQDYLRESQKQRTEQPDEKIFPCKTGSNTQRLTTNFHNKSNSSINAPNKRFTKTLQGYSIPAPCMDPYERYIHKYNYVMRPEYAIINIEKDSDPVNYNNYLRQKKDMKDLPESEQKAHLLRIMKEAVRANQGIQQTIENFRRTYMNFLQRSESLTKTQIEQIKQNQKTEESQVYWSQQFKYVKDLKLNNSRQQLTFTDFKEISKMFSASKRSTMSSPKSEQLLRPLTMVEKRTRRYLPPKSTHVRDFTEYFNL